MRRISPIKFVILTLTLAIAGGARAALAGDGSLAGSFAVNNQLPAGWELRTVLTVDGSTEALASHAATSDGSSVAFSFDTLDPGSYRVALEATEGETVLGLSETTALQVGGEPSLTPRDSWKAIGSGGAVYGEIQLSGQAPAGQMILVRARRVDIDLEGKFPDQLNAFTIEVQSDEIEAGSVHYEFNGMSYGLYAVELIAYHYETHTTQPIETYPGQLAVDLEHEEHQDIDFAVSF